MHTLENGISVRVVRLRSRFLETIVTSRSIKSRMNGKISGKYEKIAGTKCGYTLSITEDALFELERT